MNLFSHNFRQKVQKPVDIPMTRHIIAVCCFGWKGIMTLKEDPSKKGGGGQYAQYSLLATVPAVLVAGPLIGYFAGSWADGKLGTEPYLMISGVFLGFGAAGIEIYDLVKRAQKLENRKDDR
jgi:F0F1-type ATP synthase assembly protein I